MSWNVDSCLLKDTPDKPRAIVAKIVDPTQTIGETDSRHDGFVEPGFRRGRIGKRKGQQIVPCEACGGLTRIGETNELWLESLPERRERRRISPVCSLAENQEGQNERE
jgi:hypothetical protein